MSSTTPIFFSSFIDIFLCRPTGDATIPRPPVRGFFPSRRLSFTADQREASQAFRVFYSRKVFFLSPLLLVADQREAPHTYRPSRYCPPSLDSPRFHSHSVRSSIRVPVGILLLSIGCCHLGIELNAPSCDRPFVPPRLRSHPDSAIGIGCHLRLIPYAAFFPLCRSAALLFRNGS